VKDRVSTDLTVRSLCTKRAGIP